LLLLLLLLLRLRLLPLPSSAGCFPPDRLLLDCRNPS
jgi:hypothetical protein